MEMNILKLYKDHHIPIAGPGQRHYRHGWVNTPCPFCTGSGKPGNHLGFCVDSADERFGSFVCYRCGGKKILDAIARILGISKEQARTIIASYGGISTVPAIIKPKAIRYTREVQLPPRTKRIQDVPGALKYVLKRRFDPDYLEQVWGVIATGPASSVHIKTKDREFDLDYSYRLVVPIYYQGRLVTYQCRDWTGKARTKYMAAHPSQEAVPIKDILYGLDKAEGIYKGILVEGVTDVWRIGVGAVACFGIKYRPLQAKLLVKRFKQVLVMFDTEPQAKVQAKKISRKLEESGIEVELIRLPPGRDPADLTQEEVKEILR